jgi:hypothetical protein
MSLRITTTLAAVAGTVLLCSLSAFAALPNPSAPVGRITAETMIAGPGMKPLIRWSAELPADANAGDHAFYIRQEQLQDFTVFDLPVPQAGEAFSPLVPVDAGSKFELWAVRGSPLAAYLLDTTVVSPYLPRATVTIRSEDPYPVLPRTRADRPFHVDVAVQGIVSAAEAPNSLKGVTLVRHAQSYGAAGTGANLDRSQAMLLSQSPVTTDGAQTLTFAVSGIQEVEPLKARGEERFSLVSLPDDRVPESIISSRFIQIWPVAGGSISGLEPGQVIGPAVPQITLQLSDLYPSSTTYAQVYQGGAQAGVRGTILPGSRITVDDSVPADRTLVLGNYGAAFDSDGLWTLELVTETPFGTDRIAHLGFSVQGLVTTIESWRQIHFGTSGDGEDLADFEKDGLPNLVEYAFGLDPKSNSAGRLPVARRSEGDLEIRFTRPAGVGGILYGAEWSTTLLPDSWVPIPDSGEFPEHLFRVPVAGKPRLYLRLKVTRK